MLTIIGCGNSNRSDDGVGVFVAQALQGHLRRQPRVNVRVFDAGTGGMDVMFQARGANKLMIVDASSSGSEAGALFELPGEELQRVHEPEFGLHDFRWDHALVAGRKIFREQFPSDVTVFLIEAHSLDFGLELSPEVRASACRLVEQLARTIDAYPPSDCGSAPNTIGAPSLSVTVARGNLYLSREVCDACFGGVESVALLERDGQLLVVPLTPQSGGGLLLKIRNARGDRVVHAQEFLREKGYLEDFQERSFSACWNADSAALAITGLPKESSQNALKVQT